MLWETGIGPLRTGISGEQVWGLGLFVEGPSYGLWFALTVHVGPFAFDLLLERTHDSE